MADERLTTEPLVLPPVVSEAEWRRAHGALMAKEKAATRARDALAAERRRQPMVRIEKTHVFDTAKGNVSLADLFEGRRQLIVYHFMFGPGAHGWPDAGCPGCSMFVDQIGHLAHLNARDVSFALVSIAPLAKIEAYRKRMGWSIPWVSSAASDFNRDFGMTTDQGEKHGLSVFLRDGGGRVYRTYFTTERGVEALGSVWTFLDLAPFGPGSVGRLARRPAAERALRLVAPARRVRPQIGADASRSSVLRPSERSSARSTIVEASPSSNWDHYSSVAELAARLRQRRASPVEFVAKCLQRIEDLDPQLNAFITVAAESGAEAAGTAETEIEHGKWRGSLHGIPLAVKDFYDTSGMRTTAGAEQFKRRVPTEDAAAVKRLKDAGAIIVGKTNMHALGMGTTGLQSAFGPVRNPWNPDFIAGGSSSGSAAAVASGMCCATLDTDAIGSCRLPAACCGVVGFKGTYSLIDVSGILAGEQPPSENILLLSHAGVMARKVEDIALVLDALVGRNRDRSFADGLNQEAVLRIGAANNLTPDSEVLEAFEQAVETIRGLGYPVAATVAPLTDFSKGTRDIDADRMAVPGRHFQDIDILLLPTAPKATPPIKEADKNPMALSAEYTMFANYFGLPAVSVPCGFDRRGLPLGLQIVGRPWDEESVLQVASRYQNASVWTERRPIA
jgi:aspartyl-tRNA(Asn)/glutamyl-tRNA(Gln) amidotransferase subunit A